jgi:hypothetical protein
MIKLNKKEERKKGLLEIFNKSKYMGEITWKQLSKELRKKKWSNTITKNLLDEMIEEGTIIKQYKQVPITDKNNVTRQMIQVLYKLKNRVIFDSFPREVVDQTITYFERWFNKILTGKVEIETEIKPDDIIGKKIRYVLSGDIDGSFIYEVHDGKIVGFHVEYSD